MKAIAPRDIQSAPPSVRDALQCSMRMWSAHKRRTVLSLYDDRLQKPFHDPVVASNLAILRSLLVDVIAKEETEKCPATAASATKT